MARPVLVFNAVPHAVVAVSRSLAGRGVQVTFADITGQGRAPGSRAIHDFVRLPNHRSAPDRFIDALCRLIENRGYDMLIPCSDPGLAAAIEHYDRLSAILRVGCPPPEVVRGVLEKSRTLAAAAACGISIPLAYDLPHPAALEASRSSLRFPLIAKPLSKEDETLHAFKMRYFACFQDLRDAFLLDARFGARHLIQEYCAGEGVGVEVLFHQRQAMALFEHRRSKELPVTGGGSVTSVSEALDPILVEQAVALLRRLGWEGPAMVEFKQDRSAGRSVLMEVNGRYWGSLPLAIAAGFDFPLYEWQLAHGETPAVPASYRTGLWFRWLGGDIRRLGSLFEEDPRDGFPRPSKSREVRRFCKDFTLPHAVPAIWAWSDPRPAGEDLWGAIRAVAGSFVKRVIRRLRGAAAEYRYHGPRNALVFLRLRALDVLGRKQAAPPLNPGRVRSVLFVCHGNIIRSVMAEALLRRDLAGSERSVEISSAGLTDEPQERADERARMIAPEFGVSLDDHRPRRLTAEMARQADAIFIMDTMNEARIRVAFPEAMGRVFYLGALTGEKGAVRRPEIADPNQGTIADVRRCYRALEGHVRVLAEALRGERTEARPAPGAPFIAPSK